MKNNTVKNIAKKGMLSFFSMALLANFTGCIRDTGIVEKDPGPNTLTIKTSGLINDDYIGNGVQWDPYPQAYRYWGTPISEADWNTIYQRLDFMKPGFMRVVIGSYDKYAFSGPDEYNPDDFF